MSPTLDAGQIATLERRLSALQAELEDALASGRQSGAPVELDQTRVGRLSRMDAMQGQAMARAATQRTERELAAVKGALKRLHSEDFGLCLECGEPIPWKRLHFNPGVRLCIECAQAREHSS